MYLEALKSALEQANAVSLGIGFIAGFLFSFNPVALAAIPVSLAYVTKAHETRKAVLFGSMFILRLIVTHALLGLIAAFGGAWVQKLLGREWGLVLGPAPIVLGLIWPGWVRLPIPAIPVRAKRATSMWGAFALGAPFSVATCPVCTPALIVLLGVAAGAGSPLFGVLLLLAFGVGRAVPIIMGAWAMGALESLAPLSSSQKVFEIFGGATLILSGLYMLNAYFFVVSALAG